MPEKYALIESTRAPQPVRGTEGAPIIGPTNPAREAQNPDILVPPRQDHGTLPNLRWSFADSHMHLTPGGWGRQTTARELPVSTEIAGVSMRLKAGGVREMHWHKAAEWAFMLKGRARITAIDQDGRAFQDDVGEGDLWYFGPGIPHSIQGLEGDGCEFLLVFDDGNFSEEETFLLTDWLAHTPTEVLAKNFGVPENAFARIPEKELWIFQAEVPGPLAANRVAGAGQLPMTFSHRMMAQEPIRTKSGTVNFQAGDVGAVPFPMGHYIENIGGTTLRFLEIFRSDHFADVSLAQWLAFTPHELVRAHLNIDESVLEKITTLKAPVVPA
jgi:oxalate decarboxylase